MVQSVSQTRRLSLDLARIVADLQRAAGRPADLLAIGSRLSRLGAEVAAAYEHAFLVAVREPAA